MTRSPTNQEKQEKITGYWWRGLRYAATSACTIIASYLMQIPEAKKNDLLALDQTALQALKNDLLLLFIPVLASVYFFTRYAIRFPRSEFAQRSANPLGKFAESEAVRLYPYLILLPYSAFAIYHVSRSESVSYNLLLSLGLLVGLFLGYGRFLAKYETDGTNPLIRHWLISPVILSIAVPLFYGLSFSDLKISLLPLVPVILIVSMFLVSLKLSKRWYLWFYLLGVLGVTTVAMLAGYLNLSPMFRFSSILFCIAASAYLAVFEAASITSDIARDDRNDARPPRYAQATLVALTATVWLLPFYYIFSSYGSAFLVGFTLHAFTAFIIWFYFGEQPYLSKWRWSDIKLFPGLIFLGLLALAPTHFFTQQWSFHYLKRFPGWGFGLLGVVVATLVTLFVKAFVAVRDKDDVEAPLTELFRDRINFTRILSLLCFIFCCGIALRLPFVDESLPGYARAELACLVYMICLLLCPLMEIRELFRPKKRTSQAAKSVIGVILIIRAFTSTLIALAVFLPLYIAGKEINEALSASMPFFLAAAGGFAINDYNDLAKDQLNKPYRALPSGKLTPAFALAFGVSLLMVAFIVSFLVYRHSFELVLYLVSIAGVALYTLVVNYMSLSKTVLTAAVSVIPIFYVTIALSYPSAYLLIPTGGLLFLLGRELLMDIRDMGGDRLSCMKTLPMVIGSQRTATLAFVLMGLCGVILVLFSIQVWSVRNALLTGIVLSTSLVLPYPWSYKSGKYRRSVIIGLYIPILCGIFLMVR